MDSIFFNNFVYLFLAVLGLCCCSGFSLVWRAGATLQLGCVGFSFCGAQASVIVAYRLSSSSACGIFPDQGSNLCVLHWQADSLPWSHQGSPRVPTFEDLKENKKTFFGYVVQGSQILGIEPGPLSMRTQSPNHWTTRKFPEVPLQEVSLVNSFSKC